MHDTSVMPIYWEQTGKTFALMMTENQAVQLGSLSLDKSIVTNSRISSL